MSSSMMKVTLKVKLTKFRLNFISAKAASMKELCYSSSSPETEFTVIFNGDISGLIFAAIRKAIICCSLDCKCTKRLFCK